MRIIPDAADGPRLAPPLLLKEETEAEGENVDCEVTFISMFQGMRSKPSKSTDSVIVFIW